LDTVIPASGTRLPASAVRAPRRGQSPSRCRMPLHPDACRLRGRRMRRRMRCAAIAGGREDCRLSDPQARPGAKPDTEPKGDTTGLPGWLR
jgi:hypothetical protein